MVLRPEGPTSLSPGRASGASDALGYFDPSPKPEGAPDRSPPLQGCLKDLADVQEMIRTLNLPLDLADQLNPFVQESYRQMWRQVHDAPAE